LLLLLVIGLFLGAKLIKVKTVEVEGLSRQNSETVISKIFEGNEDRSSLMLYLDNLFGKKKDITFIQDYEIEFKSPGKVKVIVYEKSLVGYLECMGQKWYFDKDGIVVESLNEELEGVPKVTGMDFSYLVIGDLIPIDDNDIFNKLLELTQLIKKYSLNTNHININSDGSLRLYMGNVRVELGDGDMLNEKMFDLNDISKELEDVPGVLDMREYDSARKGYTFKKDSQ